MSRKHVWLFVLLCALWGFSFVALKVALRHVDPIFLGPTNVENDEHPPSNIQVGQNFASNVINSLTQSPL